MKTNLFIAGFSKSGTTSLYDLLVRTRHVVGGNSKEPSYFSTLAGRHQTGSDLDWSTGGNHELGPAWYQAIYTQPSAAYQLDASTIYSFDPASPGLIHAYHPRAKILFVVRDPYDRIESHYFQEVKTGMRLPPFEQMVEEGHDRLTFYKRVTRYKESIERYRSVFPDSSVKVIGIDMLKDPAALRSALGAFLGVSFNDRELLPAAASNRRRVARLPQLKRALIAIERSRLARLSPRKLQRLGSGLFRRLDRVLLQEVGERPGVPEPAIEAIRREFLEDLRYLEHQDGITFPACVGLMDPTTDRPPAEQ